MIRGDWYPPVYVIHLLRNTERRIHMAQQLKRAGIKSYSFVEAVDGQALSASDLRQHVCAPNADFDRALTKGEVGCYMSHIRLLERIQRDQSPCAVVLEDDIVLHADLGRLLPYLAAYAEPWHFIHLVHPHTQRKILYKWRQTPLVDQYRIATSLFKISTTGAYMVSQRGIKAVLKKAWPVKQTIDRFLFMHENNAYFMHLVLPALVQFSSLNDTSNIRTPQQKAPLRNKTYYVGRLKYHVSIAIWTLFSFLPLPKRMHRQRRHHAALVYYALTLYDFLFRRSS